MILILLFTKKKSFKIFLISNLILFIFNFQESYLHGFKNRAGPANHGSGSVWPIGKGSNPTGIGSFEPAIRLANRTNQSVPSEPNNSFSFPMRLVPPCHLERRPAALSPGASSRRQHPRRWEPRRALKSPPNLDNT